MSKDNKTKISDELLAAYLEGNTTPEETARVLCALEDDEQLREILITAERLDSIFTVDETEYTLLPMEQLAATTEDNLCDFQCEEYILQRLSIEYDAQSLSDKAKENRWLKDQGTPLHSVGRLLEQKGLSVTRKYKATIEDLMKAFDLGYYVIVVVNVKKMDLENAIKPTNSTFSYHAMVLLDFDANKDYVSVFDPADNSAVVEYSKAQFLYSWEDSLCYMVCAAKKSGTRVYNPHPIDLEDVELTENMIELREAIAENAHDVWAAARINEGWTQGPVRDDDKKQHPDLIPYADLPDLEKQYDRDMAMNTIKLVRKLGYDFVKHSNKELHRLLINTLRAQKEVDHCKKCGASVFKWQLYCDQCGNKLDYNDFCD